MLARVRHLLIVAAAVGAVVFTACSSSSGHRPGVSVVCAPDAAGQDVSADRGLIQQRADALARGSHATVTIGPDGITATIPGAHRADAERLCHTSTLQFRGLLAPVQTVACGTACVADPLPGDVVVPNAEVCPSPAMPAGPSCQAFADLTAAQQRELEAGLSRFACSSAAREDADPGGAFLACDQDGKQVYLLGHSIVDGSQVASASAQAPDLTGGSGNTQWTVALHLTGVGANAWHAWTTHYNTQQTLNPARCAPTEGQYCSYFVAFVLDGTALALPITQAPLSDRTQISGGGRSGFSEKQARQLAAELSARVPLHLARLAETH